MMDPILNLCSRVLEPGDRIVAAVSGGADSMCLAHALSRGVSRCGAKLFIAHVNHQLRGEEAEADARFVCAWARQMGLPRYITRVDVRREKAQSLESIARRQRYRALARACEYFGANKLATAHHADDQVETFFINLLRGSGGRGLLGIPAARPFTEAVELVRPLLAISRATIEAYCRANDLAWRTDATNESLSYQRNYIRHKLLPQLLALNPGFNQVLLNTMEILRGDQGLLEGMAKEAISALAISSPLPFAPRALSASGLARLEPALQNHVVLTLLPPLAGVKHVKAVLALLTSKTGAVVDLPGGWRAYRLSDGIAIGGASPTGRIPSRLVPVPGTEKVGDLLVRASTDPLPGCHPFWLPEGIPITVSSRRPGDYLYLSGGGKKLKEHMIDCKIPRWLRDQYPVFRCGDEIFWVAGLARDQRFSQPGPSKMPVYINILRLGES